MGRQPVTTKKLKVVQVPAVEGHEDADLGWLSGDLEKDWEFFEVDGELHARWIGACNREDGEQELVWYSSERYWGVVS